MRERSTKEVRNEVIEDDGVAVPLVIPRQKGETQLAIKETTLKGRRYVLCRNEEEARKDADRRAAILAGLDRKLAHGDKALVSNKGFRRFVKTIGSGNFSIDYDKAEADAKFDGLFVLRWLARGRDEFGCLALLNACSEAGSLRDRSVCSGLDCFLFPSRNSSRRDANLRAAL